MNIIQQIIQIIQKLFETIFKPGLPVKEKAKASIKIFGSEYRSQVLAARSPYSSCFSHAMAGLLQRVGIGVTPDQITALANDRPEWIRRNFGNWVYNEYRARENKPANFQTVWVVQKKIAEDLLAENGIAEFDVVYNKHTKNKWIKDRLHNKMYVVVQTSPIYNGKKLGHIMRVEDYQRDNDCYIVVDSFGDFLDNYKTGHINQGNDLIVPVSTMDKIRGPLAISLKLKEKIL